jgi:hypothetical protein
MGVSHFDYGFSGDPVVWQNNESIAKKLNGSARSPARLALHDTFLQRLFVFGRL